MSLSFLLSFIRRSPLELLLLTLLSLTADGLLPLSTHTLQRRGQEPLRAAVEVDAPRAICTGCRRPMNVCLCDSGCLPPGGAGIDVGSVCEILVLQHPAEARKKANTVPLMELVLGKKSLRVVRGRCFNAALVEELRRAKVERGLEPLLLFPGPGAEPLEDLLRTDRKPLLPGCGGAPTADGATAAARATDEAKKEDPLPCVAGHGGRDMDSGPSHARSFG